MEESDGRLLWKMGVVDGDRGGGSRGIKGDKSMK
jgi:hypothetical protein